ncbi:MAG: hypothetical protein C0501_21785 [Isosphaera sp.]|nr:hypothetical protein [Isosphaera sp.]
MPAVPDPPAVRLRHRPGPLPQLDAQHRVSRGDAEPVPGRVRLDRGQELQPLGPRQFRPGVELERGRQVVRDPVGDLALGLGQRRPPREVAPQPGHRPVPVERRVEGGRPPREDIGPAARVGGRRRGPAARPRPERGEHLARVGEPVPGRQPDARRLAAARLAEPAEEGGLQVAAVAGLEEPGRVGVLLRLPQELEVGGELVEETAQVLVVPGAGRGGGGGDPHQAGPAEPQLDRRADRVQVDEQDRPVLAVAHQPGVEDGVADALEPDGRPGEPVPGLGAGQAAVAEGEPAGGGQDDRHERGTAPRRERGQDGRGHCTAGRRPDDRPRADRKGRPGNRVNVHPWRTKHRQPITPRGPAVLTFFRCVAESVAAKGVVSLAKEIPFGTALWEVASDAWRRFRGRKAAAEQRAEVQRIAQAAADEVRRAAAEAAREAFPDDREKALELELYLTQIPAAVRRSLRRTDDPSGKTVPSGFALSKPEDVLALLPERVSKFRPGSGLPGRDGWTLTDLLGTGGFGEVWLAAHPHFASLKRAVKFCLELTDRDRTLLHEGGLIDRVMRAGPVPNVVPLIDANLAGDAPWLMYEYVPGGDLVSLAAGWRDLAPADRHARAVTALRQVAGAVAHFHRLGVVHRDLKPANVLVSPAGSGFELKVADFGIGGVSAAHDLAEDRRATSTGARLATVARGAFTPIYASPQQKRGDAPDPRDDVYALGVIGYQLLAGDVAAERPGGKGWRRDLLARGVSPELLDLLEACWDDAAAERPAGAGELLARLDRVGGAAPATPRGEERREPTPETPLPSRKTPWAALIFGVAALVLLTGGVITFFVLREDGRTLATAPAKGVPAPAPKQIDPDGGNKKGGGPKSKD